MSDDEVLPKKRQKLSDESEIARQKRDETIYRKLLKYRATPSQMDRHGYPRPDKEHSDRATFSPNSNFVPLTAGDMKKCVRCEKSFSLSKVVDGTMKEKCVYHTRRSYQGRPYLCCGGRSGSKGCTSIDTHVHADNLKELTNYVKTTKKPLEGNKTHGIFAMDTEMSYTVIGRELTRVSIVDHNRKTVFDSFVKPEGRVLDYNTKFSGVTKADIDKTEVTLKDVQKFCLENFSADTILIGHSLESELVVCRIIHETVVDTSLVFPHPRGLPHKRALKTMAAQWLGRNIQDGNHSSKEDALACMDLILLKV